MTILALASLFAISRHRDMRDEARFPVGLLGFGTLFILASVPGFLVALNWEDWLYATLRTGVFVCHIILFAQIMLWNRARWHVLVWYITATASVVSLVGILQWGGGIFLLGTLDPPYATMMHENLFASFLFLSTPLVLFGAIRWTGLKRIVFIAALAIMMVAVVISTTRATWAALTLGAVLTGLLYVIADRKLGKETLGRTGIQKRVAAILIFVILLIGSGVFVSKVSDRFDDLQERTFIWKKTIQLAMEDPFLGVGAGNWVQHTNIENMMSRISQANWIRPHNDPLWVLSETGVFGLAGYLGLFGIALWMLWRVLRNTASREQKLLSLIVLFGLLGFFLISNSGFPRERIEHTAYFAMLLALSAFVYLMEFPGKKSSGKSAIISVVAGIVILLSGFSTVVGWYRTEGEKHMTVANTALTLRHWQTALPNVEKAHNPFYSAHPNGLPLEYMRGVALYELERYDEALFEFERAYELNDTQFLTWWWMARSYYRVEEYELSVEYFEICLNKWPNNIFSLPGIAIAKYQLGRFEEAYEHMYYYREMYNPEKHREGYEDFWSAVQERLGPERIAELNIEFEVPELRRKESKQNLRRKDIIGDK